MNMKFARTLITLVVLFSALSLCAQSPQQPPLKVSIPFAFSVDSHLLPAGEYRIESMATERAMRISSADGKYSAVINTVTQQSHSRSASSHLVFQKHGNEYYLAEVWRQGDEYARIPVASKRQRTIAQGGDRTEQMNYPEASGLEGHYRSWSTGGAK